MPGTYTNLVFHLVFSTKNRLPLISRTLQTDLYSYIGGIIRREGGALIEIGGMPDHVHLLVKLKPTKPVSEMPQSNQSECIQMGQSRENEVAKVWMAGRVRGVLGQQVTDRIGATVHPQPGKPPSTAVVSGGIQGIAGAARH